MAEIKVEMFIQAPIADCFDAARNIDLHTQTVWKKTKERAISGITKGYIELHDTVTFEAVHFGVKQRLTSKITEMESPVRFVDEMQRGAFKAMKHTHTFKAMNGGTWMTDVLVFRSPLGWIGKLFDVWVLESYMCKFVTDRNLELKKRLEAGRNEL